MSALLKLCAFASVLVFSSSFARADDPVENSMPCQTTQGYMFYNLSALQGTEMAGQPAAQDYTFYMNMCTVSPACIRDGGMICQISNTDPNTQYTVAFPNDDRDKHYWSTIPGGIQLTAFGAGQWCDAEGLERVGVVKIMCDTTVTGPPPRTMIYPVVEGPPCTYTFTIPHISGCGSFVVNTTSPPPTTVPVPSSSTDQSKVTGAGVGVGIAIGVAITAVCVIVYVYVARRGSGGSKWNKFGEEKNVNMGTMGGHTSEATNM